MFHQHWPGITSKTAHRSWPCSKSFSVGQVYYRNATVLSTLEFCYFGFSIYASSTKPYSRDSNDWHQPALVPYCGGRFPALRSSPRSFGCSFGSPTPDKEHQGTRVPSIAFSVVTPIELRPRSSAKVIDTAFGAEMLQKYKINQWASGVSEFHMVILMILLERSHTSSRQCIMDS